MDKFRKIETFIEDLFIIEPSIFGDSRGFFMETYNRKEFNNLEIDVEFVQDNHSKSRKGILRGLHFQTKNPQAKLVRVIRGGIFDIAVDLRKKSSTYARYFGTELTEENKKMLFIPKGFGHGFLSLTEEVEVVYKASDYYSPDHESGIIWNDPTLDIQWPFKENEIKKPKISLKDSKLSKLEDLEEVQIFSNS